MAGDGGGWWKWDGGLCEWAEWDGEWWDEDEGWEWWDEDEWRDGVVFWVGVAVAAAVMAWVMGPWVDGDGVRWV